MKSQKEFDEIMRQARVRATKDAIVKSLQEYTTLDMRLSEFVGLMAKVAAVGKEFEDEMANVGLGDVFSAIVCSENVKPTRKPTRKNNMGARILALLKEKPMTISEVVAVLKDNSPYKQRTSIYSAIRNHHFDHLYEKGLIEPLSEAEGKDGKWRAT